MDKRQEPVLLDGIVQLTKELMRGQGGVTVSNIGELISTIGEGLSKYTPTPENPIISAASSASSASSTTDETPKTETPATAKSETASQPTSAPAPAIAKASTKTMAKSTAAKSAKSTETTKPKTASKAATPAPSTPTPVTAELKQAESVAAAPKKVGRPPKAKTAAAQTVASAPVTKAIEAAAPPAPVVAEKKKPGRKSKKDDAQASLPLTPDVASETFTELSDDPKAPNYRFKAILDQLGGKWPAKPFNGMKIEDGYDGEWVFCFIDGEKRRWLHKHLKTVYHMTPEQYRVLFNLPADYKIVAPGFSAKKSVEAKGTGFGKRKSKPAEAAAPVIAEAAKAKTLKATPRKKPVEAVAETPAVKKRGRQKAVA